MQPSACREHVIDLLSHPLINGPDNNPPGATEAELRDVEKHFGVLLPAELRDWLSVVNGAFCGGQRFMGAYDYMLFPYHATKPWLPVADDGCGDYYLVDLAGPDPFGGYPVFFWDHERDVDLDAWLPTKGYAVASNIWIFSLQFLRAELRHELADRRECEEQRSLWEAWNGPAADGAPEFQQEPWRWPFDRERTLKEDPDLAKVTSAPLPWEVDAQD